MLEATSDQERRETEVASAIVLQRAGQTLRVEPWGRNSVRVRLSLGSGLEDGMGALLAIPPASTGEVERDGARCRAGTQQFPAVLLGRYPAEDSMRVLKQAQSVRNGAPTAFFVPNKLQANTRLSRELLSTAGALGLPVLPGLHLRQAYADAVGQ